MQTKLGAISAFMRDASGASTVEFSLVLGAIGLGVFAAATLLSGVISAHIADLARCYQSGGGACN